MKTMWFKWGEIFLHRPYSSFNYTLSILKIQDLLSQDRLMSGKMTHVSISKKDVKYLYNMACVYVILLFNTLMQAHWFPWDYAGEIRMRFHSKKVWVLFTVSNWLLIAWWSLIFFKLIYCYCCVTVMTPPPPLAWSFYPSWWPSDDISTLLRVL